MLIIKRNGETAEFKKEKIKNAVLKAFEEVDGTIYEEETAAEIANNIEMGVANSPILVTVETIQDWVEDNLMASERKDVARAYIRYRYKKEVARNKSDDFIKAIREKLDATNVQNQNANVDEHSFGGRIGEASSVMTKQLALDYICSPMARENHLNNKIYIHDLDAYYTGAHNCLTVPIDDLLANGFNTRQVDIRPAGSINTAMQLVAVIFQLQSLNQFGGVSASHIDWSMVPYVRKSFAKHYKTGLKYILNYDEIDYEIEAMLNDPTDWSIDDDEYKAYSHRVYEYALDMTIKETQQAVEGLYHNLNSLQSRSGEMIAR